VTRNWPTYAQIEAQLRAWAADLPGRVCLEELGCTAAGRPLLALRISDAATGDEDKEHVLITANHAGARERTATTGVLSLARWLLGDEALAAEIRRRQVVVCMPVGVPDSYEQELGVQNAHGLNPCNDWTLDGPVDADHHPEGVAVQELMDRYQPEVHSDYHGLDLTFPGHMSIENTGGSYGSSSLRPYHHRLVQLMDEAALQEGYPSDLQEQDGERLLWGPDLEPMADKLWSGRPRVFAGMYCYRRYHSLVLHSEVYWERSGFLKHRRLLQAGNEVWPGEAHAGYPTRVVAVQGFNLLAAYGATAAARRRSRVELWNRQEHLVHGTANPNKEGVIVYLCATSARAAQEWLGDRSLKGLADRLAAHPHVDAGPLKALVPEYPDFPGQWGAEANVSLPRVEGGAIEAPPVQHGLCMRLRLPYPAARLVGLQVNGRPAHVSAVDGYQTRAARGWTYVEVNVPPEVTRQQDLFVVTGRYDPGAQRTQGQW